MRTRRLATALATTAVVVLGVGACSESDADPRTQPSTNTSEGAPTDGPATYVALGDSFTAAPGVPVTDDEDGCGRSDHNYPALVAAELELPYVDVSCSGASTLSLDGVQQTRGGPKPPQLDALTDETELVTLGIGGNDLSLYGEFISTCLGVSNPESTGAPCRDAVQGPDGDRLLAKIGVIQKRVTAAVRDVHDLAPAADVVLVGYPQLVAVSAPCVQLPIAAGDYAYAHEIGVRLGNALERAAGAGGATYVDMVAASRGHDICAGDEAWVNGIISDPERAMALHPFAEEQEAVAGLVVAALER